MTNKKALITGIAGQDGSYLAELLLAEGFEVFGTIRRNSTPENQENRIHHLENHIKTFYADLTDSSSMLKILKDVKPTHIFNLAAQSHVRISFEIPLYTAQVNGIGALNFFDVINQVLPQSRVYQASSSEMFGTCIDNDGFQRETTPMMPSSPYGAAKLYSYWLTVNYREAFGIFASNGILFNHESPRRGETFVTRKISKAAARISRANEGELVLGNLNAVRDWGFAGDYVKAMQLMLAVDSPDDFVVATGRSATVREFVSMAFLCAGIQLEWQGLGSNEVGIDARTGKGVVRVSEKYYRPSEVDVLIGNSSKAEKKLGWKPEVQLEELVKLMVESDLRDA